MDGGAGRSSVWHRLLNGRAGLVAVAGVAAGVAAVALLGGLVLIWPSPDRVPAAHSTSPDPTTPASAPSPDGSPSPSPTPSPSPSPSPSASPTPTGEAAAPPPATSAPDQGRRRSESRPTPKPAPIAEEPAPPPPAAAPPPADVGCPYYDGENAPKSEVGAALEAAAAQAFWTVSQVSLPPRLIKAVAEQESGWQSAIIACDGGIGTMQVMPNTADWMNQRFGTSHDVHTLRGNTMLGSAFLQWLIKYFGDVYFDGDYTVRDSDCQRLPEVPDHREWCLLNAVISAYNYGHGAVDAEANNGDDVYYPNHQYIENVRALMARF